MKLLWNCRDVLCYKFAGKSVNVLTVPLWIYCSWPLQIYGVVAVFIMVNCLMPSWKNKNCLMPSVSLLPMHLWSIWCYTTFSLPCTIHSEKCWVVFNRILGQIWTNWNTGLKNVIQKCNTMAGCLYLTQNSVKKPQHFFRVYPALFTNCKSHKHIIYTLLM